MIVAASAPIQDDSAAADAERRLRRDLAAAYRLVALHGLDDSIFTHISARLPQHGPEHGPGPERFLINAYGERFDEVTAGSLVTVDLEGRILDDPTGWGINPAGFTIHSAIHAARPDAVCVLHTHTPAGVALSCQRDGLLPLNQWSLQFHGRLAYHDYEAIALDLEERERLAADLGDRPAMILRNHGLLTVGTTVAEGFSLMYYLNKACELQIAALSGGRPLVVPPPEVCAHASAQFDVGTPSAGQLEWQALLRRLDREEPDYRT
jgi:ribulose-5-phosphate 4-epimerase/fuculose-1-phosphate aldolase